MWALEDLGQAIRNRLLDTRKVTTEAIPDQRTIYDFGANPVTVEHLRRLERRSPACKRVQDEVAFVGRDFDAAARYHRLQFVNMPARFEFPMTGGGSVVPEVAEVEPERVKVLAMSPVVLDVLAAVPALRDRQSHAVESRRGPFRKVKQRVMGGVKLPSPWEGPFHRYGDPMAEFHPAPFQMNCQVTGPLRQVIDENAAARPHYPDAFVDPAVAPVEVFVLVEAVKVGPVPIVLAQVERRVGKNGVDAVVFEGGKQIEAVSLVDRAEIRGEGWEKRRHVDLRTAGQSTGLRPARQEHITAVLFLQR